MPLNRFFYYYNFTALAYAIAVFVYYFRYKELISFHDIYIALLVAFPLTLLSILNREKKLTVARTNIPLSAYRLSESLNKPISIKDAPTLAVYFLYTYPLFFMPVSLIYSIIEGRENSFRIVGFTIILLCLHICLPFGKRK